MVTTAGAWKPKGMAYWKWPTAGRSFRRRRGRATAMRSTWLRAGKLDRLDPFRHQIGPARHGGETQVRRRERAELTEEVGDVGLVTRAPAAEHVGVDHDERRRLTQPPPRRRRASPGRFAPT